jgi:hypothetical protein
MGISGMMLIVVLDIILEIIISGKKEQAYEQG